MVQIDPIPDYLYTVIDETENKDMGYYEELTGGDLQIAMVSYNLAYPNGSSTTKFVPGQTSFAPVTLKTALSQNCQSIYDDFMAISGGAVKPRHFSIKMIDQQNIDRVIWDLYNAMPTAIGGFLFNKGYITSFRVTIQAEWIEMKYVS